MSATDEPASATDPLLSSQLTQAADQPFIWSPEARPLSTLRTWVNVGLIIALIGQVILIFTLIGFILLEGMIDPATYEVSIDYDLYSTIYGLVAMLALAAAALAIVGAVIVAIFHSRIVFRATKNLVLSKAKNIDFSPSWAVWVHYIPILSLWMPIGKVSRIYAASHQPRNQNGPSPNSIGWWWGLLVLSSVASRISQRIYTSAEDAGDLPTMIATYWLDIASTIAVIISSILLIGIHRKLNAAQDKLAADFAAPTSPQGNAQ